MGIKRWIEAVTGHHGHFKRAEYVSNAELPSYVDPRVKEIDRTARLSWLEAAEGLFLKPEGLTLVSEPPAPSPLLAGFCSVSDWLASRCDDINFTFQPSPRDLGEYFRQKAKTDAREVLRHSGIIGRPRAYAGVDRLLSQGKQPHPLQVIASNLPLQPGVNIIEAPTGSGKTEAALAHAWRLIDAKLADSIIFALPTQATSNAMFGRLEQLATKLFADSPNLLLAHGYARFNKSFVALKNRCQIEHGQEEDGWVICSQWLHESRKRVFLGQIGVCTIDQVLISVLPVRHNFVRGFGVGRSVLIVDEVHAYDAYMYKLLEDVLQQQRTAGGSAILLSATLPAGQKQDLFSAWGVEHAQHLALPPYPLISFSDGRAISFFSLPREQDQAEPIMVKAECLRTPQMLPENDKLVCRIIAAAEAGAQVAIICNLVDVAQKLAERIKQATEAQVDLFHSRFRFKDRSEKEISVIKNFGPSGDRSKGRILVATQVVEQSLDIDFDWLITQLCPIDLLFQRIGRLHRHYRPHRPPGFTERLCTILLPQDDDYGGTGVIYANIRALWRTEQKLIAAPDGKIMFPEVYRSWIESVYSEEPWPDEPETISDEYRQFEEKRFIARCKAQQQRASAVNPFSDSDEIVSVMTRDGEMSLPIIPYLNSLEGKRLLDGELVAELDEYELLEYLAMNRIGVPNSWNKELKECAQTDERPYWLEMHPDREGFIARGENVIFRYNRETGLRKELI